MLCGATSPPSPTGNSSWDIYADNVQLADPSGVQTRGLQNYKQFFGVIRMFRRVMIDKVDITFKLRYDWSKKIIKVTWYSKWYARGSSKAAYVDATSSFHLDDQGKVFKHVVDRVQVGGRPLSPPYSVGWLAFREYVLAGLDVPSPVPSFGFEASQDAQDALVLMSASDGEASEEPPAKKKAPRAKEKKQKRKLLPGQCEGMWFDSPACCDLSCSRSTGWRVARPPHAVDAPLACLRRAARTPSMRVVRRGDTCSTDRTPRRTATARWRAGCDFAMFKMQEVWEYLRFLNPARVPIPVPVESRAAGDARRWGRRRAARGPLAPRCAAGAACHSGFDGGGGGSRPVEHRRSIAASRSTGGGQPSASQGVMPPTGVGVRDRFLASRRAAAFSAPDAGRASARQSEPLFQDKPLLSRGRPRRARPAASRSSRPGRPRAPPSAP